MNTPQITAQMAAAHRSDMIAAAEASRLARQVRRGERRHTPKRHVRSPWARLATRPASS
jgi:hypothetical protein